MYIYFFLTKNNNNKKRSIPITCFTQKQQSWIQPCPHKCCPEFFNHVSFVHLESDYSYWENTAVSISSRFRCLCVNHYGWRGVGNYLRRGWASQILKMWVSIPLEFRLNQRVTNHTPSCLSGLRSRSHQLIQTRRLWDVNPQLNSDGSKKQTVVHLKIMVVGLLQVAASARAPTASFLWLKPSCCLGLVFQWSEEHGHWVLSLQLCLDAPR